MARVALADHLVMRGRLLAAGIARHGVDDALDMLEHALNAPEAAAGQHRDFGRLPPAASSIVGAGITPRLLGRRSRRGHAAGCQKPNENERRKAGASPEGRDQGPNSMLGDGEASKRVPERPTWRGRDSGLDHADVSSHLREPC